MPRRNQPFGSSVPAASEHISTELMRQYAAGTLPPAQQYRVEAHTLECARCAEVLDGLTVSDAQTTDEALLALRHRLHTRVATEATPARSAWLGAAAAVVLLMLAASAYWLGVRPYSAPVAQAPSPAASPAPAASPPASTTRPAEVAVAPPAPTAAQESVTAAPVLPRQVLTTPTARQRSGRRASAASRLIAAAPVVVAHPETAGDAAAASDSGTISEAHDTSIVDSTRTLAIAKAEEAKQLADYATAAPVSAPAPAPHNKLPEEKLSRRERRQAAAAAASATPAAAAPAAGESNRPAPTTGGVSRVATMPPVPDLSPLPVGGYKAFRNYLKKELKYPEEAREKNLEGLVVLKFVVAADASLQDIKVVSKLSPECDAEAIRLLKEGPAWYPALSGGKRVPRLVRVTVPFAIEPRQGF